MPNDGGSRERRLPAPPRPIVLFLGLGAGVIGTGLLYSGATGGGLLDLLIGAPLFGVGLRIVGRPFVVASALVSDARAHRRRRSTSGGRNP